jgi:hypothetical protein
MHVSSFMSAAAVAPSCGPSPAIAACSVPTARCLGQDNRSIRFAKLRVARLMAFGITILVVLGR